MRTGFSEIYRIFNYPTSTRILEPLKVVGRIASALHKDDTEGTLAQHRTNVDLAILI